ncbi:MAG: DUF308 domain-containing protein [Bacilli bacterium]|nr:DUF308 domain-containing protein [Bacilli bacterium]
MKYRNIITAIGYMVMGLLCIIFKEEIIKIGCTIFGIILIIEGVLLFYGNKIYGIIMIAIGIIMIIFGFAITKIVLYVVGALLIFYGISNIVLLFKQKAISIKLLLMPIGQILIGSCFVFYQALSIEWMFYIIGALLIIEGLIALLINLIIVK